VIENTDLVKNLALDGCCISKLGKPGEIKKIFTSLEELSLENNLLHSWQ